MHAAPCGLAFDFDGFIYAHHTVFAVEFAGPLRPCCSKGLSARPDFRPSSSFDLYGHAVPGVKNAQSHPCDKTYQRWNADGAQLELQAE